MMESVRDDGESGKASEKPSPVRERQCETREKLESAKRQKMQGGESGSRSSPQDLKYQPSLVAKRCNIN